MNLECSEKSKNVMSANLVCMTISPVEYKKRARNLIIAGLKVPTFSYFSGFFLLFPTLGSNSYFFLLF